MTDMNQSFIRAFAKKNSAENSSPGKSTSVAEGKPSRRAATSPTATPVSPKRMMPPPLDSVAKTPSMGPRSMASLFEAESVLVYSTFEDQASAASAEIASPGQEAWNSEAVEAAKAAATGVPRGIAAKSTLPAPPAAAPAPVGPKKAVQRVDGSHRATAKLPKITPAWEVDSLLWPRTCDQLLASEKVYFQEAAGRLLEASRQGMRTLAICETRRGEGCSTVALCIAKAAAAAGLRIGLLDADFHSDGLAEMLGLEVDCNWTLAAGDAAAIHEQSVQVLDQAITLFPLYREGRPAAVPAAGSPLTLLPQIAEQFDLLIVDFGVCNDGALQEALHSQLSIDAALVVRDLRHTSSRSVHATVNQIRQAGIEAVGIAENFGAR